MSAHTNSDLLARSLSAVWHPCTQKLCGLRFFRPQSIAICFDVEFEDHLGTPMKLLNQSGITVWSATYDAFGKATIDPASTITNNLRFPGQYFDTETGLHYNWMRYYDPRIGRYITSDPIGLHGGKNFYIYVRENPMRWKDPIGLLVGTGTGSVQGSLMFGPIGGSVSVGGVIGTDGQKCVSVQVCLRIGFGFFAGIGLSGGVGANAGGTSDSGGISVGVGGDVAVGGAGVGGQATVGLDSPSAGASRGSLGVGIGLAAGVDVCITGAGSCRPICQMN